MYSGSVVQMIRQKVTLRLPGMLVQYSGLVPTVRAMFAKT